MLCWRLRRDRARAGWRRRSRRSGSGARCPRGRRWRRGWRRARRRPRRRRPGRRRPARSCDPSTPGSRGTPWRTGPSPLGEHARRRARRGVAGDPQPLVLVAVALDRRFPELAHAQPGQRALDADRPARRGRRARCRRRRRRQSASRVGVSPGAARRAARRKRSIGSGSEALNGPAGSPRAARVEQPVVQAVGAALPELDRAAARRGSRPSAAGRGGLSAWRPRTSCMAASRTVRDAHRLALRRGPGREARAERAAGVVRIRVGGARPCSTAPSMRTCRSRSDHWNTRQAAGRAASSRPLRLR